MRFVLFLSVLFALAQGVRAHCPLCTVGAAAAATGAVALGVSTAVVGVFVGAFAAATGAWFARLLKRSGWLRHAFVLGSVVLTVLPLRPLFLQQHGVLVSWFGEYGTLFNRIYLVDGFLFGAVLGLIVIYLTPWISKKLSLLRGGKLVPFQGVLLTFVLLVLSASLLEVVL